MKKLCTAAMLMALTATCMSIANAHAHAQTLATTTPQKPAQTLLAAAPATNIAPSAAQNASNAPSVSQDAQVTTFTDFTADVTPAMRQDDADLWQRVRRGFAMDPLASPLVQDQEQWYAARQDYIRRFVERGSKYMYHIVEELERRKMPTEIVLLPIIESAFNPQANSRAKASGMWQFIPSTGKFFGLKQDWLSDHRRDVLRSTDAALDYLQKLHGMFNSWELAFAAYNCGEGCVGRAIAANQRKGLPTDFLSLNLPAETRSYVPKLIAVKNIVLSPATYGIELNSVLNQPYFIKVAAPDKIDVKLAASLAEMPENDFAALNPAFNKPVAANMDYFLVPTAQAEVFKTNLDLYRSLNGPMVSWQTVTANRGQSVDSIAKRYGMTGSYLRATNGPFKERKGKLTQPATFMVPMSKEAKIIDATLDKKVGLRASAGVATVASVNATSSQLASAPAATATAVTTVATAVTATSITPAAAPIAAPAEAAQSAPTATLPASGPATYQVQPGDTLFAISKRFGASVDAIKQLNSLHDNQLQPGQNLILLALPDDSAQAIKADTNLKLAVNAKAARPAATRASRASSTHSYTVKTGDTLFAIAQKFSVSIDNLLRWNKLSAKAVIKPGVRLRVS